MSAAETPPREVLPLPGVRLELVDDKGFLNDAYAEWMERTAADYDAFVPELRDLIPAVKVDDEAATARISFLFSGYIVMAVENYLREGCSEREIYAVGQRAVVEYFKALPDRRRRNHLEAVIGKISSAAEIHVEEASNLQELPPPQLKLVKPEAPQPKVQRAATTLISKPNSDPDWLSQPAESGDLPVDQIVMKRLMRHRLLSASEEINLAQRFIAGDPKAKELLIRHNTRLVASIAYRYRRYGVDIQDLIQDGMFGLIRAVEKFDPSQGYKLSTYATWWIRQTIERALADTGRTIRLPVHIHEKLKLIRYEGGRLERELRRTPTIEELSAATDFPVEEIVKIERALSLTSLDTPLSDKANSDTLGDLVASSEPAVADQAVDAAYFAHINTVLDQLPARIARMVRLRFGLVGGKEHTYEEIGQQFDVTRERVRQIINEALPKLQTMLKEETKVAPGNLPTLSLSKPVNEDVSQASPTIAEELALIKASNAKPAPPATLPPARRRIRSANSPVSVSNLSDYEQRISALEQANRVRQGKSALKQRLKSGRASPRDALNDQYSQGMELRELLIAIPGVGKFKMKKILKEINISPETETGALSREEKDVLIALLPINPKYRSTTNTNKAQVKAALLKANETRLYQADKKRQLLHHETTVSDILADRLMGSLKLGTLLHNISLNRPPGSKPRRVPRLKDRVVAELGLAAENRLNELTSRQQSLLLQYLAARGYA